MVDSAAVIENLVLSFSFLSHKYSLKLIVSISQNVRGHCICNITSMINTVFATFAAGIITTAASTADRPAFKHNTTDKFLVSSEQKIKASADELRRSYGAAASFVKNGFTAYRITYNTVSPEGKKVQASGAIYVPDVKGDLPMFNYNHGTIFPSKEQNAPSYMNGYDAESGIGKLFAANGYLVVMPDYLGYGKSKDMDHPYGAYLLTAKAVTDMLYAAKEFCGKKDIPLSGKNFFSGWSEGAAVTLATVLDLEKNSDQNFKPAATVLNAGPYYTSAFVDHVLDATAPLRNMSSYVWVLQSYNRIYHIDRPTDYYFNDPYAKALTEGPEATISHDAQELFNPQFRSDFKSGKDTALVHALIANDLWNGTPNSPVVFCHGDKDEYVPLFNSQKAYDAMKAKGADVTLNVFKGQNHTSGVFSYLQTAFAEFEKRR